MQNLNTADTVGEAFANKHLGLLNFFRGTD